MRRGRLTAGCMSKGIIMDEKGKDNSVLEAIYDIAFGFYKKMEDAVSFDQLEVIRVFSELGRTMVNSERASFWKWEKEEHKVVTSASTGTGRIEIADSTGLVGRALRENRTIITNDPYNHPDFNKQVDMNTGFHTKSIFVMPVDNCYGETIGAFQAINIMDSPEGFQLERDSRRLSLVALVCGFVLESELFMKDKMAADAANKAKSTFLAHMSHEIRTPINAILGMDEIILRESKEKNISSYAMDIRAAGKTLLSLINDILDFSKVEEGKMEIIPTEYDLGAVISELAIMVSDRAERKGLELKVDVDENIPSMLIGDEVRIKQCILNILINGVKYTEKGSVTLKVSYEDKDADNIYLIAQVIDTGIGIKKEDMEKLFSPFTRLDQKRNKSIEGTGLGMSLTMKLLELMGTRLEVESVYGEGSTFTIRVVQGVADRKALGSWERSAESEKDGFNYDQVFQAPGAKVLMVDDNTMNRKVFIGLLKESEMDIRDVDSGKGALEALASEKFDIVFLDHMMPEIDGIEVIRRHRKDKDSINADTPIIALSANAITGAKEMYLSEGFTDYLSKPVQVDKLEDTLVKYLPEGMCSYKKVEKSSGSSMQQAVLSEDFPSVEGVDWNYAMLKLHDEKLLRNVISDYVSLANADAEELTEYFEALQKAFAEDADDEEKAKAFKSYEVKVHAMKSAAAMFGALEISSLARLLEFAAKNKDMDRILTLMPIYMEERNKNLKLLKEAFDIQDEAAANESGESIEDGLLAKLMKELLEALADMDVDSADAIAAELKKYSYEDELRPLIERLGVRVQDLDEDGAREIVDKIVEKRRITL